MSCEYDPNAGILKLSDILITNALSGSVLIFNVDSFINPYSGMPRSGFTVKTTDSVGGTIDSSVISGLKIVLIVTGFTSFQSISLSRADTMQTVGELSEG